MSDYMIQKASDQIDAGLSEKEKLQKENRYLRMALNRLYSAASDGELMDRNYIKETLASVPRDMAIDALLNQDKRLQSRIKELEDAYTVLDECYKDQEKTIENSRKRIKELEECVGDLLSRYGQGIYSKDLINKHKDLIESIKKE